MGPIPRTLSYLIPAIALAALVGLWSPPIDRQAPASPPAPTGLPNFHSLGADLWSGGMPDGDEGFRSLRNLGIKTVISVDGIRPDVERAHQFGLRYIHIPVEYGGIASDKAARLAHAARDFRVPLYVHCHHGQHRGPAAAALMRRCRGDGWTADEAVAFLKTAGTDPKYEGLYDSVREPLPPDVTIVRGARRDFYPEVAEVPGLMARMVEIDDLWDAIKWAKDNGWQSPNPSHSTAHLALQLNEQFREAVRLPEVSARPESFRRRLDEAETATAELDAALRAGSAATAETAFDRMAATCTACHREHRDHKRPSPSPGR